VISIRTLRHRRAPSLCRELASPSVIHLPGGSVGAKLESGLIVIFRARPILPFSIWNISTARISTFCPVRWYRIFRCDRSLVIAPERLRPIQEQREEIFRALGHDSLGAFEAQATDRFVQFVLGDPEDNKTPAANLIEIPAYFPLPRHTHDCDVLMVVIKGSIYADDKVLRPGDVMTAIAHEFYGPEVAGPEGCARIEFFASLSGFLETSYEKTNGELLVVRPLDSAGEVFDPRELVGFDELEALSRAAKADAAT
jgi:hypothetical protein